MGKLILLAILGFVVWRMWHKLQSPSGGRQETPVSRPAELMVSCAHCGVNQPRSECVESQGRYYCCDAHRRQAEGGNAQ